MGSLILIEYYKFKKQNFKFYNKDNTKKFRAIQQYLEQQEQK